MFKKKNQSRSINLNQQAQLITAPIFSNLEQPQMPNTAFNTNLPLKNRKKNMITLDSLQKNQAKPVAQIPSITTVRQSDIDQCFQELQAQRKLQIIIDDSQLYQKSYDFNEKNSKLIIKQQNLQLGQDQQFNGQLQVQEDLQGGLSPVRDNDDWPALDYQQMLIKKTLTKSNYDKVSQKVGVPLHKSYENQAKQDLFQKVTKVSQASIKRTIARDIYIKRQKLKEIQKAEQQGKVSRQNHQDLLNKKQTRLKRLKQQFQRVKKVIEFIYYKGDKIKQFTVDSIYQQTTQ